MPKPGCQFSMWVSPVGRRDPRIWAISCLHGSHMWRWLMGTGCWDVATHSSIYCATTPIVGSACARHWNSKIKLESWPLLYTIEPFLHGPGQAVRSYPQCCWPAWEKPSIARARPGSGEAAAYGIWVCSLSFWNFPGSLLYYCFWKFWLHALPFLTECSFCRRLGDRAAGYSCVPAQEGAWAGAKGWCWDRNQKGVMLSGMAGRGVRRKKGGRERRVRGKEWGWGEVGV